MTTKLIIKSSQDLLDVCDIEITYKGQGGVNTIDTITTTKWEKEIVNDSFPATIGVVAWRFLVKPGFKPTKDKYDLECKYTLLTKEQEYKTEWCPLHELELPGDEVIPNLEDYNSYYEQTVKSEGKPNHINCGILIVTKNDNDSTGTPFIIKIKNDNSDSTGQLMEEQPIMMDPSRSD